MYLCRCEGWFLYSLNEHLLDVSSGQSSLRTTASSWCSWEGSRSVGGWEEETFSSDESVETQEDMVLREGCPDFEIRIRLKGREQEVPQWERHHAMNPALWKRMDGLWHGWSLHVGAQAPVCAAQCWVLFISLESCWDLDSFLSLDQVYVVSPSRLGRRLKLGHLGQ